jgi:hypothetical protein
VKCFEVKFDLAGFTSCVSLFIFRILHLLLEISHRILYRLESFFLIYAIGLRPNAQMAICCGNLFLGIFIYFWDSVKLSRMWRLTYHNFTMFDIDLRKGAPFCGRPGQVWPRRICTRMIGPTLLLSGLTEGLVFCSRSIFPANQPMDKLQSQYTYY